MVVFCAFIHFMLLLLMTKVVVLLQQSLRFRDDQLTAVDLPNYPGLPNLTDRPTQVPREVSRLLACISLYRGYM